MTVSSPDASPLSLTSSQSTPHPRNPLYTFPAMKKRLQEILEEIPRLEEELASYPPGQLHCERNGKYLKWYLSEGADRIYLTKRRRRLAEQLAIKKYLGYCLEDLQREKNTLEYCLRKMPPHSGKAIRMLTENPYYKDLLAPYFRSCEEAFQNWSRAPYPCDPRDPAEKTILTPSGQAVRSYSDARIAAVLSQHRIPYRYECQLSLEDAILYPRFTILHPLSHKPYYIEHFTHLDDLERAAVFSHRLSLYTSNGLLPGHELLLLYSDREEDLQPKDIEHLLRVYLDIDPE